MTVKSLADDDFKMVCVVAMAQNRVIGDGQGLIWHLPGDLKRVKALTMGCPLLMGRRTWQSIGRALPGRLSVVLTRDENWSAEGAVAVQSMQQAIEAGMKWLVSQNSDERRLILFGGGQIYAAGLDYCSVIEATIIDSEPDSGVCFPQLNPSEWTDEKLESISQDADRPAFHYHKLTRKAASKPLV